MGLDVYVGPLSRYYSGQWETVIQRYCRENGMPCKIERPAKKRSVVGRVLDLFRPRISLAREIATWQADVGRAAGISVTWNDSIEREYFTDKPDWRAYGALLLWASYVERGIEARPASARGWPKDPVWADVLRDVGSRYRHLTGDTEIWLPAPIRNPLRLRAIAGEPATVGSVPGLLANLRALNDATWRADADTISSWRQNATPPDAPLEEGARFGFAVMFELAELADQHRLPMKLDY